MRQLSTPKNIVKLTVPFMGENIKQLEPSYMLMNLRISTVPLGGIGSIIQ